MNKEASIHVKVTPELKDQFTDILAGMGLTPSIAMGMFAYEVINSGKFPFTPKAKRLPNAETQQAIDDIDNERDLIKYGTVEAVLADW